MDLTREQALALLQKYNHEPFHIQHALTVEGVMRWFAQEQGEDPDFWGLCGLLHDVDFEQYKVCVVPQNSSTQDAGTQIPTEGGSLNTSGSQGSYPKTTPIEVTITGTDLAAASAGDGVKIVKVFVCNAAGTWSVA